MSTQPAPPTNDWQTLFEAYKFLSSLLGIPALAAALVAFALRIGENRQLYNQNIDLEALRSRLRLIENQSTTQFDWLHQRRAEAIVAVYSAVIAVDVATSRLVFGLTHGHLTDTQKARLFEVASAAGDEFRSGYAVVGVLLPDDVLAKLRALDDLIWKKYVQAGIYGKEQTVQDRLELYKASTWDDVTASIETLRQVLRTALGDLEP